MKTFILIAASLLLRVPAIEAQQTAKVISIDVTDFTANQEDDGIRLSWFDNNPQNLKEIEIEKSLDGNFSSCNAPVEITIRSGNGQFSYTDHQPQGDILYYRLKRYNNSGQYEFSEIIAVKYQQAVPEAIVFPNPVRGKEFFVNVAGEKTTVKLYSGDGKLLYYSELNPENGEVKMKVEVPFVNKGLYRCVVEGRGNPKNLAVVVE
jgi:hypothetical protein